MFLHPDLLMTQFENRQRELIAEADRQHLLAIVRRRRRRADSTSRAARNTGARADPVTL